MRRLASLALAVALLVGGCGDGGDEPDGATEEATNTAAQAEPMSLQGVLRVLRSGNRKRGCRLYTVRYLYYNYSRPRDEALGYCRFEARRDLARDGPQRVKVEIVSGDPARAVAALSLPGGPPIVYLSLVNGRGWWIDGVAGSERELERRGDSVRKGFSAEALEGFLAEIQADADSECAPVVDQGLGEWVCDVTVTKPDGKVRDGSMVVTVTPGGSVSTLGVGGVGGIGGCCLKLEAD
jgi:hypothetical protein